MIAVSWGRPEERKPMPVLSATQTALDIIRAIAESHGLRPEDLTRRGRGSEAESQARHEAFYKCRRVTGLPYKTIGQLFSGRDHNTVWCGIKAYEARVSASRASSPLQSLAD